MKLGAVRSLLGEVFRGIRFELRVEEFVENCEAFDRVGSCKENVLRNARYLFVLGVVRNFVKEIIR